jgi:HlyD family secretion protein
VEVGLDNNRMIRILKGVEPGEEVMLAPPVKVEPTADDPLSSAKGKSPESV